MLEINETVETRWLAGWWSYRWDWNQLCAWPHSWLFIFQKNLQFFVACASSMVILTRLMQTQISIHPEQYLSNIMTSTEMNSPIPHSFSSSSPSCFKVETTIQSDQTTNWKVCKNGQWNQSRQIFFFNNRKIHTCAGFKMGAQVPLCSLFDKIFFFKIQLVFKIEILEF